MDGSKSVLRFSYDVEIRSLNDTFSVFFIISDVKKSETFDKLFCAFPSFQNFFSMGVSKFLEKQNVIVVHIFLLDFCWVGVNKKTTYNVTKIQTWLKKKQIAIMISKSCWGSFGWIKRIFFCNI